MQVNVAGLRRNIKNLAHNYSDAQVKVREATSNDPWGPSATIMAEIADLTLNVVAFSEIMQMIWKRLNDHGKNWRHVYKALILLEYLIKTGSEKVAQQCKENIFAIQTLREFVYFEEGKDQGTHVREKAKQLGNLLRDDERLKNERIKALKAKERFAQHPSGFGSDGYIDGPSHRDMPPGWQEEPKTVSELEMVRPQTAGEEELQLQLAMAMSREEAEQEEAKRRSDDVRLQLALSQSEQDFKPSKKDEPQSHLLDLLDISLGATSISSPPQLSGAIGGLPTDPWGTPARAASQLSDPWSGTSSPQIDPWQPAAAGTAALASAVRGAATAPIGATGINGEGWSMRTQSPSVVSGSSGEGWLHNNNGTNGNMSGGAAAGGAVEVSTAVGLDPWLSKTTTAINLNNTTLNSVPPAALPISSNNNLIDPWITDKSTDNMLKNTIVEKPPAPSLDDPWKPTAKTLPEDPWRALENAASNKKISPDLDEFDIISNRNKTAADAYALSNSNLSNNNNNNNLNNINNNNNNNSNNNNNIHNNSNSNSNIINNNNTASLLDDMDPLAPNNLLLTANQMTNGKKQLKTPQAFLGENSALVNLDNLIKPVVPQTQSGSAAYNPFSDTVVPPKTNLFQQQQPAVPSINQLKQQQPFAMTINQDPWAPVGHTANVASQFDKNQFYHWDFEASAKTTILTEAIVHNSDNATDIDSLNNNNNSFKNNNNNNNINNKKKNNSMLFDNNSNWLSNQNNIFDVFNTTNTTIVHKNTTINNNKNNNSFNSQILTDNRININKNNNNNSDNNNNNNNNSNNSSIINENNFYGGFGSVDYKSINLNDWGMTSADIYQATPINSYKFNNNNHSNNYDNKNILDQTIRPYGFLTTFTPPTTDSSLSSVATTSSYMSAFTPSLVGTPGFTIKPLPFEGSATGANAKILDIGERSFNYGFFNNNDDSNKIMNAENLVTTSSTASVGHQLCQQENNNNNMPWMKPEAAASNPFLS